MTDLLLFALNLAGIVTLITFYHRRHHKRDLVVAYVGVNVGVFAVCSVLASTAVAAGLGLGLFGVLSIIRLRSSEISQREVAYYFAALALGLLTGLGTLSLTTVALVVVLVGALVVIDHPGLITGQQRTSVMLDRAITDPQQLADALEERLGAEVFEVSVQSINYVNDSTLVEVRHAPVAAKLLVH